MTSRVEVEHWTFKDLETKIKTHLSKKVKEPGIRPCSLFILYPTYVKKFAYSSQYRTFTNMCRDVLAKVSKDIGKPFIVINPLSPGKTLYKELEEFYYDHLDASIQSTEYVKPKGIREILGSEEYKMWLCALKVRFEVAEEFIDIFKSLIVYAPYLEIWANISDICTVLRSFIKRYAQSNNEEIIAIVMTAASYREVRSIEDPYNILGYFPIVTEVRLS